MKPANFEYEAPASREEVRELLRAHGGEAKILAGGQSLLSLLNMRLACPPVVVDINRMRESNSTGLRRRVRGKTWFD